MKALKYYGVKNLTFRGTPPTVSMARARTAAHAAVRAATLATALGSLGINNAVAQTTVQVTGGAESQSSIQVDVETCQALSDSTALDQESIRTRLACYNRDLAHLNKLVTQLTTERDELIANNKSQSKSIEEQKRELSDRQDAMQRLEARAADLRTQVDEITAERDQMREQLFNAISAGKDKPVEIEANKKLFENFSQSYVSLTNEIADLRKRLEDFETSYTALSDEQLATQINNQQLQSEKQDLAGQITSLEESVANLQTEKGALQADLNNANQKLEAVKAQLLANSGIMQQQLSEISSLKTTLAESEKQRSELESTIASLNEKHLLEITALNKQTEALSTEIETLKQQQLALQSESAKAADEQNDTIAANNAEIASLNDARKTLNEERETLITKITALEKSHLEQIQTFKGQTGKLEEQIATLNTDKADLGSQLLITEEDLHNSQIQNEELTASVESLEQTLNRAIEEQKILQARLVETENKRSQADANLASLKDNAETLTSLLAMSRAHSENANATLAELQAEINEADLHLEKKQQELKALLEEKTRIENKSKAMASKARAEADAIEKSLYDAGHETVKVTVSNDNNIDILLGSSQLFRTGSARLSDTGQQVLRDLAETFALADERRIMISGHSDNVPLGTKLVDRYKDNWGLSMARALSTANFLSDQADIDADRMTVSGFGATQPVADNETAEGRQQNRRVEVSLVAADNVTTIAQ